MSLTTTQCFFNGNDIEAVAGASLIDHNFNNLPRREIRTYKLARANKSITTSAEYSDKEVSVSLHLRGCDRAETEDVMSELKAILRSVGKELVVSQAGVDTTYEGATLNAIDYRWLSNKIIVTLVFEVANPIGFEDADTELLDVNITTSTSSQGIDVDGSFDAEPIITMTYNSVTDGSSQNMTVRNEVNGQGITIDTDFATNDTLEINSKLKRVVMNGAEIEYSGTFPAFQPGSGAFGYVDSFSNRDVDIVINYNKRYS